MSDLTKGQKMVVMSYRDLSDDTKERLQLVKQHTANLIDMAEVSRTDNNSREISLAQTYYEMAIMFLTKAIIND